MGGQPPEPNDEWESAIEQFIEHIEAVSAHFGYTEEYVLDHTPEWLGRKYKQMAREKLEAERRNVINGAKSFALVIDALFNQSKESEMILPPTYDELIGKIQGVAAQTEYVSTQWWTPEKSVQ